MSNLHISAAMNFCGYNIVDTVQVSFFPFFLFLYGMADSYCYSMKSVLPHLIFFFSFFHFPKEKASLRCKCLQMCHRSVCVLFQMWKMVKMLENCVLLYLVTLRAIEEQWGYQRHSKTDFLMFRSNHIRPFCSYFKSPWSNLVYFRIFNKCIKANICWSFGHSFLRKQ